MTPSDYRKGYNDRACFGEHGHGETEHSDDYWRGFADACMDIEHHAYWADPWGFANYNAGA